MDQLALTTQARNYYEGKRTDRNFQMSHDGIVNHHFGIGDFDRTKFPRLMTQEEITRELHRLELSQIDTLLGMMTVTASQKILDAGSGRGGTGITLSRRTGAEVVGVTISPYQANFANDTVRKFQDDGETIRAKFVSGDYLKLEEPNSAFDQIITNESTMYAFRLYELFSELRRVVKDGGTYTLATWCINDDLSGTEELSEAVDTHYAGKVHTKSEYITALESSGFRVTKLVDATEEATPYWELRSIWEHASGIEKPFLDGHRSRKMLYLFIQSEAV